MKKYLFITLSILLMTISLSAKEPNTTGKTFNSNEDFFKAMAELDKQIAEEKEKQQAETTKRAKLVKRQEEAKSKTEAVIKLGKTVDEVAKQLGIDK